MEQGECAGYIITQSIKVKDSEFVLGEHPKKDMYVIWRCKDGDNYFWGHYTSNRYEALRDLCQRAEREIDYLASIEEIPPITFKEEQERER
jgi:molybdopterin-guanine dinucleotide biosynthesis protein A